MAQIPFHMWSKERIKDRTLHFDFSLIGESCAVCGRSFDAANCRRLDVRGRRQGRHVKEGRHVKACYNVEGCVRRRDLEAAKRKLEAAGYVVMHLSNPKGGAPC